ncbi:MAG: hypothetical protein OXI91_11945 [Chloroflexota bacterium]|nr:hypothetical protein [Chloroflexota bacterium]
MRWEQPFYDPETGRNDEVLFKSNRAMTRLADPSIDIEFPEGTKGPFGTEITKINIPCRLIGEEAADLEDNTAIITEQGPEGLKFRVPTGREFTYTRMGLRSRQQKTALDNRRTII